MSFLQIKIYEIDWRVYWKIYLLCMCPNLKNICKKKESALTGNRMGSEHSAIEPSMPSTCRLICLYINYDIFDPSKCQQTCISIYCQWYTVLNYYDMSTPSATAIRLLNWHRECSLLLNWLCAHAQRPSINEGRELQQRLFISFSSAQVRKADDLES